ncbi:MAG: OPT/YSL family transporter, partial [Candidatus Thorarchaeota archaeon]
SEIVVMAAGGIAVFAALKSEPKFPLTRRAIGTGIIVGIIMTFFGIYIALKIGIVYFVGAELLGFLILSAFGRYTPEENTVVVAISNSSSIISVGVLIIFPAIAIFGPTVTPPIDPSLLITYEFIALVTGLSAVFGLLLLLPFRDQFDEYPWPQVMPQAEVINSLGGDVTAKRNILTGLTAAGAWVGATKIAEEVNGISLASVPTAISPAFPDWIGISNSPLMAAIGFFIGWKRVLVMALGTVMSLSIWIILEGAAFIPYSEHLTRPEILYLALGVFATVIIGDVMSGKGKDDETDSSDQSSIKVDTFPKLSRIREEFFSLEAFKEEVRTIVKDPRGYVVAKRGKVPPWIAVLSMVLFMIVGIIIFSIIAPFADLIIPWPLFVFGAPLAVVSAYFTARAISETGMLAGYISDMVAIPAIIFFHVSFQAITTFMSMLGGLQDAAIALLIHLKLGSLTKVKGRVIIKAVFIGGLLGTFVGSLITYLLYETYSFGGTDLPAPAAQLFGFLVVSLTGLTNFKLPGLDVFTGVHPLLAFIYLFAFGVTGFLLGRKLNKMGMSAISLAVGLLVPPATTVAMLIGGFIDYRLRKKQPIDSSLDASQLQPTGPTYDKTSRILSGVIAGETIVTVIFVLFTFFF